MARGEVEPAPVEDLARYASEIVIGKVVEVSEKQGNTGLSLARTKPLSFLKRPSM
jgi:hypothetical protein